MSVVAAVMRRSYSPAMFDDLDLPAHARVLDKASGVTTLTFTGALTDDQADKVWWRMISKNDDDEACRRERAALLSAVEGDDWTPDDVRALLVAVVRDELGLPE